MDIAIKRCVVLALIAAGWALRLPAQTNVFSCSQFAASGTCGAGNSNSDQNFVINAHAVLEGSVADILPAGETHYVGSLFYHAPLNVLQFKSTFTFVPNGEFLAFVVQNTNNTPGYEGNVFTGGAGCEGGFYQAFGTSPNNIFALELDAYSPLTEKGSFTYSSTQIYQANQSPCLPNDNGPGYYPTDKISTYPVALDSPANTPLTTTGDTYSVTLAYDGSNLTINMYDVTAGGSCPGASCFTYLWAVDIPTWVDGPTAYVGFTGSTGLSSSHSLYVRSFSFSEGPATRAVSPAFSPAAGTYAGMQMVTLSTSSPGAVICYSTTANPATNGSIGCSTGTPYATPIPVSSSETLYATAGGTGYDDSPAASARYVIESAAATPAFSPAAGSYSSAQTVSISDTTPNATIYYTTNGAAPSTASTVYTGPITVSATENVQAIAAAPGDSNSPVAAAAYTITLLPVASTPTFSPPAGTFDSATPVTISDSTPGSAVYYTSDGSVPTTASSAYSGPITVSATETLQAIAVAPGDTNSTVGSATYTIDATVLPVATPTFSPAGGSYSSPQTVSISDTTAGATIYYTADGSTPTTTSPRYSSPITVSATETLQAIAVQAGDSAVGLAVYTITAPPDFMLATSVGSLTVNPGGADTVMVTVTPQNGFNSPVNLACSGLPAGATCSFAQTTLTPSGGAVTTQLTISANAPATAAQTGSRAVVPFTALAMTACLLGWRKRRGWHPWLLLAVAYAGLGLLFGCGGGASTTPAVSTAPATSVVTLTAISGKLEQTAAITVTVN